MTAKKHQMLLFLDLPMPAAAPPTKARRLLCTPWRRAIEAAAQVWLQTPIRAPLRALERDDLPADDDCPVQRIVDAAQAPRLRITGMASIFTIADAAKAAQDLRRCGRFGDAAGFAPITRVERDGDSIRVVRLLPQETAEWQEKERVRRAKQRPPKPVKGARTKSKKFKELIGGNERDD